MHIKNDHLIELIQISIGVPTPMVMDQQNKLFPNYSRLTIVRHSNKSADQILIGQLKQLDYNDLSESSIMNRSHRIVQNRNESTTKGWLQSIDKELGLWSVSQYPTITEEDNRVPTCYYSPLTINRPQSTCKTIILWLFRII